MLISCLCVCVGLHVNMCILRRMIVFMCLFNVCRADGAAVAALPHYSHIELYSLVILINWCQRAETNYVV